MKVYYNLHTNLDHCSISFNGKKLEYHHLNDLLKKRGKDYIKTNRIVNKTIDINDENKVFDKSNLSDEELIHFKSWKAKSKAKSWISNQRNLRKKGKLKQYQIDALNNRGMVWNPNEDEWEINYLNYRKKILIDVLLKMRHKDYGLSNSKLRDLKNQESWIENQRLHYKQGNINNENLARLKYIDFPFEKIDEEYSIYRLIRWVYNIKSKRIELLSRKSFVKNYNLPKKNLNVGSVVKIEEEKLDLNLYKGVKKNKPDKSETKIFNNLAISGHEEINKKSNDLFIKEIDKISKKYIPTWNDKNIYEVDKSAKERLKLLYYDKYSQKYSALTKFLSNTFLHSEKIKSVTYAMDLKHIYDDKVKEYASKKMIYILDNFLLKTENLNYKKSFKPIVFLIKYYKKENNLEELINLSDIINKHQILSLIYSERIKKIITKIS